MLPPQTVKNAELYPVYTIFPAILLAVFKKAVGMETEASADLKGFLQVKYKDIEVKFLSDTSLKVKLGWITQPGPLQRSTSATKPSRLYKPGALHSSIQPK